MELHPLQNQWNLWFHKSNDNNWNFDSYIKLASFDNLEDFAIISNALDEIHVENAMLFLMRKDIKPMWEDPANCNGGAFSYKINHRISYSIWRTITYLAIGEQLDNTGKNIITGITISPKKNFSIIKVWVNTDKYTNIKSIASPSSLNVTNCIFKKHLTT